MFQIFIKNNISKTIINDLNVMANRYNNSCHRSIKMKPVNVAKENEPMVWMNIYKGKLFPRKTEDLVRITTEIGPFKKSL